MISHPRSHTMRRLAFAAIGLTALAAVLVAQEPQKAPAAKTVPLVAATLLQPLLPDLAGWTKDQMRADKVGAEECSYSYASARYTKGDEVVTITLNDTGFAQDSLLLIASMVVTLPHDYLGKAGPAATLRRLKIKEAEAAERWDSEAKEGDLVLQFAERFVITLEGKHIDAVDTLYKALEPIDLSKLSALK